MTRVLIRTSGTWTDYNPAASAQPRLTKTAGGVIQRNGTAFRTGGINIFNLALNDYPSIRVEPQTEQASLLDKAVTLKAGLVRAHTLGASVGPNTGTLVKSVTGTTSPVITYDQTAWDAIDYAIAQAAARGLYLMIPMVDELGYFHGGKRHWVNFRRPGTVSLDYAVKAANSSTQRTAEGFFYTDSQIKADFKQYLSDWLNHVNQFTGRANKDEPAIAIIETGNELWTAAQDAPAWTPEIAAWIKSIAPNVLVADGSASDGSDPTTHAWASSSIDILGTHPYSTYGAAQVTSQAAFATSKGKAYLIGEYPWSKTAAPDIEAAVRTSATFSSAPWSLQNDADLHNAGAGYGGDDASFYVPGKTATEIAGVSRVQTHHQALIDNPTPAAPVVGGSDNFNRTSGLGGNWAVTGSAGDTATIVGNALVMALSGDSGYADHVSAVWTGSSPQADQTVTFDLTPASVTKEAYLEVTTRAQAATDAHDYTRCYRLEINQSAGTFSVAYRVAGANTLLTTGNVTIPGWAAGATRTWVFSAVGSTLTVKIGGTTVWTVTDTRLTDSGYTGFSYNGGAAAVTNSMTIDNWSLA